MTKKKKLGSRKPTITKTKNKLWKELALYMKRKHSIDGHYCSCYTCGRTLEIGTSDCHLGHWLTRRYTYHFYNENNLRPQCYDCNINKNGDSAVFEKKLRREIGDYAVDEMYNTREVSEKRDLLWYQEKLDHYRKINKATNQTN